VACSRQGPSFILSHFDVLFSSLVKFGELSPDTQSIAWKTISQGIQQLNTELDKYFANDEIDSESRQEFVTITKMIVYLLCQLLDTYETRTLAVPGDIVKGRGKTKKKTNDDGCDLEAERNFTLVNLYQLIQLPINKLWTPPVVEQDFVNLVSNLCYKILENPVLGHVRMKATRESVFQVRFC
jgi:condensin complex subunit 1